eukprot:Clim_evm25s195 gene=Clim_evmTU25s195
MDYCVYDVFARSKYNGNQLAVVFADVPEQQQQNIAKEFNYSETTFVAQVSDTEWRIRIYTPTVELAFAGHPLVGSAKAIFDKHPGQTSVTFITKIGPLVVRTEPDPIQKELIWLTAAKPTFGSKDEDHARAKELVHLVGLDYDTDIDQTLPVCQVSGGMWYWLIPVKAEESLAKATVKDVSGLVDFVKSSDAKLVYLFTPPTATEPRPEVKDVEPISDLTWVSRMFGHAFGVPEDPATGSANASFAAYCQRYICKEQETVNALVLQGLPTGRPSFLHLKTAIEDDGSIKIMVGGNAIKTMEGNLTL